MNNEESAPLGPFATVPRLVYVEVDAIHCNQTRSLNSAMVKQQLIDWSIQSLLVPNSSKFIIIIVAATDHREWQPVLVLDQNGNQDDIICLESSDPLGVSSIVAVKCCGYVVRTSGTTQQPSWYQSSSSSPHPAIQQVIVDEATLVRVVDSSLSDWKLQLTGEAPDASSDEPQGRIFCDGSVRLQLQNRAIGRYMVGTAKRTSSQDVRASLDAYESKHRRAVAIHHEPTNNHNSNPLLVIQGALLPADAVKLVKAMCRTDQCYVLRWGALRAKYGVYADWGLACTIHSISMSCAVRNFSCTIIMVDVWEIIDEEEEEETHRLLRQYLERLINELKRHRTIVFPEENPLYGMNHGTCGVRLSVRLNLIAIAGPNHRTKQKRSNVDYITVARTPTIETRLLGLQYALVDTNIDESLGDPAELKRLAETVAWARGSVFERIRHRLKLVRGSLSVSAFEAILEEFGPVVRCITSQQERAGGNDLAKQALEDAMNPEVELESLGLTSPTGILLYGPPGTGKTLLAKSLSRSMIVLHSTDVAQSTVGQGEKAVLEAFENARTRNEKVTVIFIDEFQALFTDRSSFGGSSRVTTTLFQCMDNLSRWRKVDSSRRIIVLAATNTPWMIDEAFLRPGRFDRTVYVGLPSCEERKTILNLHLQTMQIDEDRPQLSTDLALRTDCFSGADLVALCHAAAVRCILDNQFSVKKRHFDDVLEEKIVGPSSDPGLVTRIEAWRRS